MGSGGRRLTNQKNKVNKCALSPWLACAVCHSKGGERGLEGGVVSQSGLSPYLPTVLFKSSFHMKEVCIQAQHGVSDSQAYWF